MLIAEKKNPKDTESKIVGKYKKHEKILITLGK